MWMLLVSTIPAGVIGVAFESFVEDRLGKPYLIAIMMFVFALVMWYVDMHARLQREIEQVGLVDALLVGFAQALALAPGVSRSGITMVMGMARGFTREAAARYSFLLTIPVIGGAAVYKAIQVAHTACRPAPPCRSSSAWPRRPSAGSPPCGSCWPTCVATTSRRS